MADARFPSNPSIQPSCSPGLACPTDIKLTSTPPGTGPGPIRAKRRTLTCERDQRLTWPARHFALLLAKFCLRVALDRELAAGRCGKQEGPRCPPCQRNNSPSWPHRTRNSPSSRPLFSLPFDLLLQQASYCLAHALSRVPTAHSVNDHSFSHRGGSPTATNIRGLFLGADRFLPKPGQTTPLLLGHNRQLFWRQPSHSTS